MACNLEMCSSSSQDRPSSLLIDAVLDDINGMLMDEVIDDATPSQQAGTSYQAIFSSFQDILAESVSNGELCKTPETPSPYACNLYHAIFSSLQNLIDDQLHETVGAPLPRDQRLVATGHSKCKFPHETRPSMSANINKLDLNVNRDAGGYNVWSDSMFKKHTGAQSCCSAIEEENGDGILLADATVPFWGRNHALVEGPRGQIGQEHGQSMSKLPSAHIEQVPFKSAEVDHLSFEDLKSGDVYTSLYVEELSSAAVAFRSRQHGEGKKRSMTLKKHRFSERPVSGLPVFVDVREVLIICAQAVEMGETMRANQILQELHKVHGASATGNGLQRMAHMFCKALAARMAGTGAHEFEAMSHDMPSSAAVLRAAKLEFEVSPTQKLVHYFANQGILKVAKGATRLHIVDYGILNGLQWPCLIKALAHCKVAPPLLVITGIEFPQPGIDMTERLAETGRRLTAYAKSLHVPFQFVGIVTDKWEDLNASSLLCSEGEVLVVNCIKRLRHLADDTIRLGSPFSPRQNWLTSVHSLHPRLLITACVNSAHNLPFFVSRFREALSFYSNVFDMLDTLWGNIPEKLILEKSYFYRYIINVIACEGAQRVERPETYKQWHTRITKAGFEQLQIPTTVLERLKTHLKQHYHKNFLMHDDGKGWMLLGWKGRSTLAMSAWRACPMC